MVPMDDRIAPMAAAGLFRKARWLREEVDSHPLARENLFVIEELEEKCEIAVSRKMGRR